MDSHKGKQNPYLLPSVIAWWKHADNVMAGELEVFTRFFEWHQLPVSIRSVGGAIALPIGESHDRSVRFVAIPALRPFRPAVYFPAASGFPAL